MTRSGSAQCYYGHLFKHPCVQTIWFSRERPSVSKTLSNTKSILSTSDILVRQNGRAAKPVLSAMPPEDLRLGFFSEATDNWQVLKLGVFQGKPKRTPRVTYHVPWAKGHRATFDLDPRNLNLILGCLRQPQTTRGRQWHFTLNPNTNILVGTHFG